MSKIVKTIASIALPVVGTLVAPGIGTALGSTLSATTLGAVGGALGGVLGGGVASNWSPTAMLLGGATGYLGSSGVSDLVGTTAGTTLAESSGNAALQGATQGSGILGAVTGGGTLSSLGSAAGDALMSKNALTGLTTYGNNLIANDTANTAKEAAGIQSAAADQAMSLYSPYTTAGTAAANQIAEIQANPTGYIQNNELYNTLANDAQQRLLANQAASGKLGSGGTASSLQNQLLQIGNGLVQQQLSNLNTTANAGQSAAGNVSNLLTSQANSNAAGVQAANNAYSSGYQNMLSSLLALQNTKSYSPTITLNR